VIRDLPRLAEREFDVLVVGGGIYGLATAYDAAQRGLAVALVDRGDFGAATSFNHLKTIHGGLRYLQSADVARMREAVRERRTFARIAPRLVSPVAFVMPTGAALTRNRFAMRAAVMVDALLARDRNAGVDDVRYLPAGRVIAGRECRRLFDGAIDPVSSAVLWYDYVTVSGERLTFSFAKAAAMHGAVLANYVEACSALRSGPRIVGVGARDSLTGGTFDIRARVVVNATGPWGRTLLDRAGVAGRRWPLLKAMNLVTSRPARQTALVASGPSGRALVVLPWNGHTLVGTSESATEREPDDQSVQYREIRSFVAEINAAFPALALKDEEVTLVHRGIVPAVSNNGRLSLVGHSRVVDHADAGSPEVISVIGVKYTTARAVAERVVDLILTKLGRPAVRCRTAEVPLPNAALDDSDAADPVLQAIRAEMAQTLCDVVIRRTGQGSLGYPGDAVAGGIADRIGTELGWSDERTRREIDELKRFYEIT
jgi:glycerol-3-phosphate dehydrogenase